MSFSSNLPRLWIRNNVVWNLEIAAANSLGTVCSVWVFLWKAILNLGQNLANDLIRALQTLTSVMLFYQLVGSSFKPPSFNDFSFDSLLSCTHHIRFFPSNFDVQPLPDALLWNFCCWIFSSSFTEDRACFLAIPRFNMFWQCFYHCSNAIPHNFKFEFMSLWSYLFVVCVSMIALKWKNPITKRPKLCLQKTLKIELPKRRT